MTKKSKPAKPAVPKINVCGLLRWCWREICACRMDTSVVPTQQLIKALERCGIQLDCFRLQELAGVLASLNKTAYSDRFSATHEVKTRRRTLVTNAIALTYLTFQHRAGDFELAPLSYRALQRYMLEIAPVWVQVTNKSHPEFDDQGMALHDHHAFEPTGIGGSRCSYRIWQVPKEKEDILDEPARFRYDNGAVLEVFAMDTRPLTEDEQADGTLFRAA